MTMFPKQTSVPFMPASFSVYGVVADWENDVYNGEPDAPWHSLKRNTKLVKLK